MARLARIFNDFDRAEDAVQEAYITALERWPRDGVPANPALWIMRVARNRAIDHLRREKNAAAKHELLGRLESAVAPEPNDDDESMNGDDRLGMIFAACHPALAADSRLTLTLRFAAGLTVEEIAAALLTERAAISQRLVRAKRKIREAHIPLAVPSPAELPSRLNDVLKVLYLIFNEGYASSTHERRVRGDLCDEAVRLAMLLEKLLPSEPEILGLHALMLLHDSRRGLARTDAAPRLAP